MIVHVRDVASVGIERMGYSVDAFMGPDFEGLTLKKASGLYVDFFTAWKRAKCRRLCSWMSSRTLGSSTSDTNLWAILAFRLLTNRRVA